MPTSRRGVLPMNRRRFLYMSACAAASLQHPKAFAQIQTLKQTRTLNQIQTDPFEPKTLAEYQGASADVDKFLKGTIAGWQADDTVSAYIAAAKKKPSGRSGSGADLFILPDKASDTRLNLKNEYSGAIAMKTDNEGRYELWKTETPKPSSHAMIIRGLPTITRFKGDKAWWYTENELGLNTIMVPKHFVTDLASIPKPFYKYLPDDGPYTFPAIVHDWLYWHQAGTRDDADNILREGMNAFDVEPSKVDAIYTAVHHFGWLAWDSNAKLKAQGEGRLLAVIPDNPLIAWEEWKTVPSHFIEPE